MRRHVSRWVWWILLCGPAACSPELSGVGVAAEPDGADGGEDWLARTEPPEARPDAGPVDHLELARGHQSRGDHAAALLEFEKMLHDDPANYTAALLHGVCARRAGRPQVAVDAWLLAATLRPGAEEPWLNLAELTFERGDLVEAEQLVLRALALRPDRARGHSLHGRIWLARSHWQRAIAAFQRALELAPGSLHARNNLGLALIRRRDFQRAVEVLEPLGEEPRAKAYMLNNLGLAYEGAGRLPDASSTFRRALDRAPRYLKAQLNLARLTEIALRHEPNEHGE